MLCLFYQAVFVLPKPPKTAILRTQTQPPKVKQRQKMINYIIFRLVSFTFLQHPHICHTTHQELL